MIQGMTVTAVVLVAVATAAWAGDAPEGSKVFGERCSACHGPTGHGDGPTAAALQPPPRNFHDAAFWGARTPEQLRATVLHGKPDTAMPPFEGVLTEAEIEAVLAHVATFRPAPGSAKGAPRAKKGR